MPPIASRVRLVIAAVVALVALALQPALARQGAPAPAQLSPQVYLPALSRTAGPPASVRFGTGLADGRLSGEGTTFPAGLTALYYEVAVADGAGLPIRLEWTIDGQRRPELDRGGVLPTDGGPSVGGIALSTGAPLPAGTYVLRVFVAGLSSGSGQAKLQ